MDKDKQTSSKPGEQAQSGTATIRKSKRRNRNKKPTSVSADAGNTQTPQPTPPVAAALKPVKVAATPAPVVQSIAPAAIIADLKAATTQVLHEVKNVLQQALPAMEKKVEDKDRDQVKAEREAKRLAKKNKKGGAPETTATTPSPAASSNKPKPEAGKEKRVEKVPAKSNAASTDKKHNTPGANKSEKVKATQNPLNAPITKPSADTEICEKLEQTHLSEKGTKDKPEKPQLTKAERRAIQEAQRAAKAQAQSEKAAVAKPAPIKKPVEAAASSKAPATKLSPKKSVKRSVGETKRPTTHRVKLFSHLYLDKQSSEDLIADSSESPIHPAIIQLGVQQSQGTIIGANSRCIAFLNALKMVINDFIPPTHKIFSRALEALIQSSMVYLQKCRPISVSMANALKAVKGQINHLPDNESDESHKETLCEFVDTYIRDQIEKAAVAISTKVQEKISKGDVILTYGCSSLIKHILEEAHRRSVDFRVVVVDSRPLNEGQEMLRRLTAEGIRCSCVPINAVSFVMPEVTKVLVGAHALLANGYVMSRTGTAQVAMVAKSYNVPVLVCCETHKFSERVQTDAFVYNEIGDPNDLVQVNGVEKEALALKDWETVPHLTPLHLYYDITPPELVAAVVTEVAILPCTSVPVILRIKPTEVWY